MNKLRAAVIGGGAAGLCAARRCVEACFDVTVFEAADSVGGTWVYNPEINIHSSMYENMRTNLPKEAMRFSDLEFPSNLPSFIAHYDVLDYLRKYSEPIKQFIKLRCTVDDVRRVDSRWQLRYSQRGQSDNVRETTTEYFDVVFVCNGHYVKAFVPCIDGSFSGTVIHSHNYRTPRPYANKRVAVVGAGPSGVDIALQLTDVAEKIYLISDKAPIKCKLPENIEQCGKLIRCDGNDLFLEDGRRLEGVHSLIYCTGYLYRCEFLNDLIQLKYDEKMLSPTYLHCVHVKYPRSLFFIGLNTSVLPFMCFEYQCKLAIAFIKRTENVPQQHLTNWESKRLMELERLGKSGDTFHVLGETQWDYFEELRSAARCTDEIPIIVRRIYEDTSKRRRENLVSYKKSNYHIENENSFTVT